MVKKETWLLKWAERLGKGARKAVERTFVEISNYRKSFDKSLFYRIHVKLNFDAFEITDERVY